MDCETIIIQEECSCLQCGQELSKGEPGIQDKIAGSIFCSEFHWAAYYDIDDAATIFGREEREDDF